METARITPLPVISGRKDDGKHHGCYDPDCQACIELFAGPTGRIQRPPKPKRLWTWPERRRKVEPPEPPEPCPIPFACVHQKPNGKQYYAEHGCHRPECRECHDKLAYDAFCRALLGFKLAKRWGIYTVDATLHPKRRKAFWRQCKRQGILWCEVTRLVDGHRIATFFYEGDRKLVYANAVTRRGWCKEWVKTEEVERRLNDTRQAHEKHRMIAVSKYTGPTFATLSDNHAGIAITPGMDMPTKYINVLAEMKLLTPIKAPPKRRAVSSIGRKVRTASSLCHKTATESRAFRWRPETVESSRQNVAVDTPFEVFDLAW